MPDGARAPEHVPYGRVCLEYPRLCTHLCPSWILVRRPSVINDSGKAGLSAPATLLYRRSLAPSIRFRIKAVHTFTMPEEYSSATATSASGSE